MKEAEAALDTIDASSTQANPDLMLSPVLGTASIQEAATEFNNESWEPFIQYLIEQGTNPKAFTGMFKAQFENEMEQDGWVTKEAEFFMPPHHQTAFLMDYGDTMAMIVGPTEEPDFLSLHSFMSKEEIDILHTSWSSQEAVAIVGKYLKGPNVNVFTKFVNARKLRQKHMGTYFGSKMAAIETTAKSTRLSKVQIKGLKKKAPIFLLKTKGLKKNIKQQLLELIRDKTVITNKAAHDSLLNLLEEINNPNRTESIETLLASAITNFKVD